MPYNGEHRSSLQARLNQWAEHEVRFDDRDLDILIPRARKEFEELWAAFEAGANIFELEDEVADIGLIMMRVADHLNFDLLRAMERKFGTIQGREWYQDEEGHWQSRKDT